jgi:hypothetical protein
MFCLYFISAIFSIYYVKVSLVHVPVRKVGTMFCFYRFEDWKWFTQLSLEHE